MSAELPMNAQEPLPEAAQRVAECLRTLGHNQAITLLPATGRTSAEAADALGCQVAEIAKSIVLRRLADDAAVMVVASGANRVDESKVAALLGPVGKADARFVKERTGYSIGGVCPLAHPQPLLMLVDADLLRFTHIWAAAGHPHAVFRLTPQELLVMTGAPAVDIALR